MPLGQSVFAVFVAVLLGSLAVTAHSHFPARAAQVARHASTSIRNRASARAASGQLSGRDSSALFTHFVPGLGACGGTNGENDMVVALNSQEWANGMHCYEKITIKINGKTTEAQIVDECGTCETGQIDMSSGLFELFAPLDIGTLNGDWFWGGAPATASPIRKTTSTVQATSSSVVQTQTTAALSATSSTAVSTSSSTPAVAANVAGNTISPAASTTSASSAAATPASTYRSNFDLLNAYLIQMGGVILTGAENSQY